MSSRPLANRLSTTPSAGSLFNVPTGGLVLLQIFIVLLISVVLLYLSSDATVGHTLSQELVPFEQAPTAPSATPISYGQTITGSISEASKAITYELSAESEDLLFVNFLSTGGTKFYQILLSSSAGTQLKSVTTGVDIAQGRFQSPHAR